VFEPIVCDDSDACTADDCIAGGCEFNPFTVDVFVTPVLDSIRRGDTITLTATASSIDVIFTWSPAQGLSCTDCSSTFATPDFTTSYTITASLNGCLDTAISRIIVSSDTVVIPRDSCVTSLYMPNAFTPNGDGVNDYFLVYGNGIEEMHLRIFDRWGNFLFESFNKNVGWDGTYRGELLRPDVFVYQIEVRFCDGSRLTGLSDYKKGSVTLIR